MLNNIPLPDKATYIYIFTDLTSKSAIENFIEKNFKTDTQYEFDQYVYYWSLKQSSVLLIAKACLLDLKYFSKYPDYYEESAVKQNRVITLNSQYFLNHMLFFNAYPENPIPEFILDV